jgi:50S ribosomal protein L16 3-hydroxylase
MIYRNPASRFSFMRQDKSVWLFVDGQCFECADETKVFAEQLCAQDRIKIESSLLQSDTAMTLIATLFNQGSLAFGDDE